MLAKRIIPCLDVTNGRVGNPGVIDQGAKAFGNQCIVIAIDVKREADGKWGVYTHGGRNPVGMDADAVLAASIFHFEQYTVREAKDYFAERNIPVRPMVN